MAMIRPGGEWLTVRAVELAGMPAGARALDVGCGEGDTAALLSGRFGYSAVGVDLSGKLIAKGRERFPGLDLRQMEAQFLDFDSKSFDLVMMECSLSVMRLQEDAAFEAYCMLKDGGKLIITDMYVNDPDPAAVEAMIEAGLEKARRPKVENACGENERPSLVMLDGAFVVDELAGMLTEMGFALEFFEDVPDALAGFAAQAVMGHGSLEGYFRAVVPEGDDLAGYCACAGVCGGGARGYPKGLGYFLMVLRKV